MLPSYDSDKETIAKIGNVKHMHARFHFAGSGTLKSTERVEVKAEAKAEAKEPMLITTPEPEDTQLLPGEKEVSPVGHEYIEELKNEFGKVVSFHCKLCECKFNDPNAKLMHMKGRRHRLQFKVSRVLDCWREG